MVNNKKIGKELSAAPARSNPSGEGESLNVKASTAEQFWSCVKRLIAFDDPASRWEKLRSLVQKQIYDRPVKSGAIAELPLAAQDRLFQRAFGKRGGSDPSSLLLNILFALEDLERFSPTALQLFFSGAREEHSQFPDWLSELSLANAQKKWVYRATRSAPDWQRLRDNGPWSSDPRAHFLVACLDLLKDAPGELSASHITGSKRAFRDLLSAWRFRLPGGFLPEQVLLVEGPTEALLLPHLATLLAVDLDALAVFVLPAGGANQVLRRFLDLRDLTVLPIVSVLDGDATSQASVLADSLRDCDMLHVLQAGEIEDVFDDRVLVRVVNKYLGTVRLAQQIDIRDLDKRARRTAILDRLWRERGLGSFDKIGFARTIVENVHEPDQVPKDVVAIVETVKRLAGRGNGEAGSEKQG